MKKKIKKPKKCLGAWQLQGPIVIFDRGPDDPSYFWYMNDVKKLHKWLGDVINYTALKADGEK